MSASDANRKTWLGEYIGGVVAIVGLIAVVLVVLIGVLRLPLADRGPNVVTIVSAALGVIAPIVGAFFGVRSAGKAVEHLKEAGHH